MALQVPTLPTTVKTTKRNRIPRLDGLFSIAIVCVSSITLLCGVVAGRSAINHVLPPEVAAAFTLTAQQGSSATDEKTTRVIRLERDGEELKAKYQILLSDYGQEFEATVTKDGFIIPTELSHSEKIGVRVVIENESIEFSIVDISKFGDEWIIGIDNKPFSANFSHVRGVGRADRIYYITFQSKVGLDTQLIALSKDPE